MICDNCGKNTATVHLTEIIDSQMNELHLCEECARKKSAEMEQQFGLSDLLAGMADFEKPSKETEGSVSVKCSNCGLTYADFKKMGRLGCAECYSSFKKFLVPLLKRIHGSNQHLGKTIAKSEKPLKKRTEKIEKVKEADKDDIQELRKKLAKAVEGEAFEEAARLRDQIKEMEKKESQSNT